MSMSDELPIGVSISNGECIDYALAMMSATYQLSLKRIAVPEVELIGILAISGSLQKTMLFKGCNPNSIAGSIEKEARNTQMKKKYNIKF